MSRSLAGQLFRGITPIIVGMLGVIACIAFISCRHEINEVSDLQLANDASVLWSLLGDELYKNHPISLHNIDFGRGSDLPDDSEDASEDIGDSRMFRVWRNASIVMESETALPATVAKLPPGYTNVTYAGSTWRIYSIQSGIHTLEVGEKQTLRNELIGKILLDLFLPLLLLMPLLFAVLWFGIRRNIAPVQQLVQQIQQRDADNLTEIDAAKLPRDLTPLSNSVNKLMAKLSQSLTAERRFADHAAHQLRTPLSGSRLLIQMLSEANTPAERDVIIRDLATSNHQATGLVQKLLTSARVGYQSLHLQRILLTRLTAQIIAELGPLADAKRLHISLQGDDQLHVQGDEILLSLMLHNLIENAIKYTPHEGTIRVELTQGSATVRLTITDSGPGIPPEERERVFHRFYRVDESSEGSGLGLAIVAEIVARHKGIIRLETPEKGIGLKVAIELSTG